MAKDDLRSWARLGAEQRLRQLDEERQAIMRAFPELRRSGPRAQSGGGEATPGRRRRRMSAAQRNAVSQRMKKLWAERRKKKQG